VCKFPPLFAFSRPVFKDIFPKLPVFPAIFVVVMIGAIFSAIARPKEKWLLWG